MSDWLRGFIAGLFMSLPIALGVCVIYVSHEIVNQMVDAPKDWVVDASNAHPSWRGCEFTYWDAEGLRHTASVGYTPEVPVTP